MLHKPPLSPEEVTSPHSILLDYTSTLGVAGLFLGVLWLAWVWGLGPALARTDPPAVEQPAPTSDLPYRIEPRSLFLIACAPTLVGAYCEAQAATIEGGLVRLVGLAATAALATAIANALRARPALVSSLAAGAVALAAHAQIEVTPVMPAACAWFMLVFGALSAPAAPEQVTADRPAHKPSRPSPTLIAALPASLALAAVTLTLAALIPTRRWESRLNSAAEVLRDATRFRERISALDPGDPGYADGLQAIAADLSVAVGRTVNRDRGEVTHAFREFQLASAGAAADHLLEASRAWPTHAETLRAASKLDLQIADTLRLHTDDVGALRHAERAEKLAVEAAALPRGAAASNAWLATVRAARAQTFSDREALQRAVLAWESAARLDPRGLSAPIQLAQSYARLEKPDQARLWALRALDLDRFTRLDPLKGLSQSQRAVLQELAR
jgi:hypothetical protein